jgi:DNA-binding transcriptional regulator YhcF (GntR family)
MLSPGAAQSLAEQLAGRYAQRIRDRLLAPGSRLPSVRLCAEQQGVSPSTVVAAYDRLLAQGLVEARRNRGFFVRERVPAPRRNSTPAPVAATDATPVPVDATALIRAMFHNRAEVPARLAGHAFSRHGRAPCHGAGGAAFGLLAVRRAGR